MPLSEDGSFFMPAWHGGAAGSGSKRPRPPHPPSGCPLAPSCSIPPCPCQLTGLGDGSVPEVVTQPAGHLKGPGQWLFELPRGRGASGLEIAGAAQRRGGWWVRVQGTRLSRQVHQDGAGGTEMGQGWQGAAVSRGGQAARKVCYTPQAPRHAPPPAGPKARPRRRGTTPKSI